MMRFLMLAMSLSLAVAARAADPVGEVILMQGVVTAQLPGDAARTLDKGSSVFPWETITTADDSYVVMRMADGGKLTLRPKTALVIEEFSQQPQQETEKLHLLKGGLRAVSGAIGKLRPAGVLLKTPSASIGIRGTVYVARLCTEDCAEEEQALSRFPRRKPGPDNSGGAAAQLYAVCQGQSRRIQREPVDDIRQQLYFAVFKGAIYATLGCDRVDLDAVDACYADQQQIHCLEEIPRFLMHDHYLEGRRPDGRLILFNLFRQLNDEKSLCEIPES